VVVAVVVVAAALRRRWLVVVAGNSENSFAVVVVADRAAPLGSAARARPARAATGCRQPFSRRQVGSMTCALADDLPERAPLPRAAWGADERSRLLPSEIGERASRPAPAASTQTCRRALLAAIVVQAGGRGLALTRSARPLRRKATCCRRRRRTSASRRTRRRRARARRRRTGPGTSRERTLSLRTARPIVLQLNALVLIYRETTLAPAAGLPQRRATAMRQLKQTPASRPAWPMRRKRAARRARPPIPADRDDGFALSGDKSTDH
jgi:hypothetical protein